MNESFEDEREGEFLRKEFGTAPAPDYAAWLSRYGDTLQKTTSPPRISPRPNRSTFASLKWVVALGIVVSIAGWCLTDKSFDRSAFAESIPAIDNVKSLTWITTLYERHTSQDGKRTWWTNQLLSKNEYQHPGQLRRTYFDPNVEVRQITIRDDRVGRSLLLFPSKKTAKLESHSAISNPQGPFAEIGDAIRHHSRVGAKLKSMALLPARSLNGNQVNVVRMSFDAGTGWNPLVCQALFDAETKDLVGVFSFGNLDRAENPDIDPDLELTKSGPAEKEISHKKHYSVGKDHEIVVNPKMDVSRFSLDPPSGYKFENAGSAAISEEEFGKFLKVAAGLDQNRFPDSPLWWSQTTPIWTKDDTERTTAEKDAIRAATDMKIQLHLKGVSTAPAILFEEQHAQPGTFYYVGSGVNLGDQNRILFWYRPKNQSAYRVMKADLSVTEMTASELPIDLTK